jgi:hypothetical protein
VKYDYRLDPIKTELLDVIIAVAEHALIKSRFTTPFEEPLLISIEQSGRVTEDCPECRRCAEMEWRNNLIHPPKVFTMRVGRIQSTERGDWIPKVIFF